MKNLKNCIKHYYGLWKNGLTLSEREYTLQVTSNKADCGLV